MIFILFSPFICLPTQYSLFFFTFSFLVFIFVACIYGSRFLLYFVCSIFLFFCIDVLSFNHLFPFFHHSDVVYWDMDVCISLCHFYFLTSCSLLSCNDHNPSLLFYFDRVRATVNRLVLFLKISQSNTNAEDVIASNLR